MRPSSLLALPWLTIAPSVFGNADGNGPAKRLANIQFADSFLDKGGSSSLNHMARRKSLGGPLQLGEDGASGVHRSPLT